MITTCKVCQLPKTRNPNGVSPNGKRKYYVDENGKSWMGLKCPDCENLLDIQKLSKPNTFFGLCQNNQCNKAWFITKSIKDSTLKF